MGSFRRLKSSLRGVLADSRWRDRLAELEELEPRKVLGPLFSLLLDKNETVPWRAVAGFRWVGSAMAAHRMESARELMRMFMWRMNEESGNLGWGVPAAMAEAMAAETTLAREFHSILASYVQTAERQDGNFLDHAELRRDVYWGVGRLAQTRPEFAGQHLDVLRQGLHEPDPVSRGFAAWALGLLGDAQALDRLDELVGDTADLAIFRHDAVEQTSGGRLAEEAAAAIRNRETDHA